MKLAKVLVCALFTLSAHAVIPEICYDTVDGDQFCTTDDAGKVQVFVYNAGWCPPCNTEVSQLSQMHEEFENQPVTFASLSGEGFTRGSQPNRAFLEAWQKKHKVPFVVAGKFKDFGKAFGAPGSIPFTVIVDKENNVSKKGHLSASQVVQHVRTLLAKD